MSGIHSRFNRAACMAAFLCLAHLPWTHARADTPVLTKLQGIHRIIFLGDSITQAGDYVTDVDCWLTAKGQDVEVINLGLGSETASDLTAQENAGHLKKFGFGRPFISERLGRVLAETKPDLVFACYGMNDGSSLPADESGTKRYIEAVTHLREAILKAGAREVVFLTPPVKECPAGGWPGNTHDQNLTRYTDWLLSMKPAGWSVVDVHTPMRQALDAARRDNPAFAFTKDSVHPGREGHWIMASCILKQYFGANLDGIVSAERIFPDKGQEIRQLVQTKLHTLFDAWMTRIKHQRPGVAGGPKAKPGPSVEEANAKAAEINTQIKRLMTGG